MHTHIHIYTHIYIHTHTYIYINIYKPTFGYKHISIISTSENTYRKIFGFLLFNTHSVVFTLETRQRGTISQVTRQSIP